MQLRVRPVISPVPHPGPSAPLFYEEPHQEVRRYRSIPTPFSATDPHYRRSLQGCRRTHMLPVRVFTPPQTPAVDHGHVSTVWSFHHTLGGGWERGGPSLHCNTAPETATMRHLWGVLPNMANRQCEHPVFVLQVFPPSMRALEKKSSQEPWQRETVEAILHARCGK